jgi:hypothetical protein
MENSDKNSFTQEQLDALGVSPEVAAQFKAEIEAELKPSAADPVTPPASGNDDPGKITDPNTPPAVVPAAPSPAAPPATPAVTGVEVESDDDLSKQYPGGNVPIAALMAERKKRQELEKKLQGVPAAPPAAPLTQQPAAPIVQQPVVQPAAPPVPATVPKLDNKRLVQEAINVWEQNNPGQVFDPVNPLHMTEVIEYKNEIKSAYDNWQKQEQQNQAQAQQRQDLQQRFIAEKSRFEAVCGDQFQAIDQYAEQLLKNDPREQMYVIGSLQQGNLQPLIDFYNQAAQKYRESIAPKPNIKTEADKIDEINALPRSNMLPTGEKGKTRTKADVEKMIDDGSWAKLPLAEREAILDQVGGGAIN